MTELHIPREDAIYLNAIRVLRAGFLVSAALLVTGIAWSIVERHSLGVRVLPFRDVPGALADGNPSAIIDLGILAMMVTPVVLVFVIAWNFYDLRERRFAIASLLVLAVLVTSIVISLLR
jgi:uncharacterized membrane protein